MTEYLSPSTTEIAVRHEGTVVATISHERMGAGWGWVLRLLPGQQSKPHPLAAMDGTYATRAQTEAEAREVVKDAAHALVAMLDRQAQAVQSFVMALDKATADRQPTLPLGEHDPLDDRESPYAGSEDGHEANYPDLAHAIENAAEDEQQPVVLIEGPHARACGVRQHEHGTACHTNCPTCHGKPLP